MGLFSKKSGGTNAGLFIFGGVMQYVSIAKRGTSSYVLEECIDAPYDVGGASGDLFANPDRIEDNLKALRKVVGKKWADKVYAGIQSKDVLLRTVELPQMSIQDIKDAFRFEFDRFFPIPVDESTYDISFIDRPSEDDPTQGAIAHCLAAAVRTVTVENLMLAAQRVNVKLAGIEPAPVAMLRCMMGPVAPRGYNIYALAGVTSSMIVATYKDNGVVYRNTSQAFASDDARQNIANFTRDLQATLNFASTQMRGFLPERVYVGGYGATLGNQLVSSLSEVATAPVQIVNPWSLWSISNPPKDLYGWEVALGLALRPAEVK